MFCGKCGNKQKQDTDFCVSCGEPVMKDNNITTNIPSVSYSSSDKKKMSLSIDTIRKYAVIAGVVIIVIIIAVIAIRINDFLSFESPIEDNTVMNFLILEEQVTSIGEIATLRFFYTDIFSREDSKRFFDLFDIPFTQRKINVKLDGTIKIGIDTADASLNVSESNKTVTMMLPKAKILSHEIHMEGAEVLDNSTGLFASFNLEDWFELEVEGRELMEARVFERKLFEDAENEAIRMMRVFIESLVPDDYTVRVNIKS